MITERLPKLLSIAPPDVHRAPELAKEKRRPKLDGDGVLASPQLVQPGSAVVHLVRQPDDLQETQTNQGRN